MLNLTTTCTTSTTNGYRHNTTQSVVIQRGALNRRDRRVRRGYKKSSEAAKNSWLNLWKFVKFEAIFFKKHSTEGGC